MELAYYLGLCYSKLKRYDDALLYLEQVVTASYDKENNCIVLVERNYFKPGDKTEIFTKEENHDVQFRIVYQESQHCDQ